MLDPGKTGPHRVELSEWIELAPFESLLNMEILALGEGSATLTMPFCYELSQGAGVLHGGAVTALADTTAAMAMKTLLPEGSRFGTIELNTRFLKPGLEGLFRCEAVIGEPAGRDYPCRASVFSENGEQIAQFRATFRVAREST